MKLDRRNGDEGCQASEGRAIYEKNGKANLSRGK